MNPMSRSDAIVDNVVEGLRTLLSKSFFEKSEPLFETVVGYAAVTAALLVVATTTVFVVKSESYFEILLAAAAIIAIAICHYLGRKFIVHCRNLAAQNPSSIGSAELPKVLGVITFVLFAAVILSSLYSAIYPSFEFANLIEWSFVHVLNLIVHAVIDIVPAALCLVYLTSAFLNPELISTRVEETTAPSEVAVSFLGMCLKAGARLAPMFFGGLTVVGCLSLAISLVNGLAEPSGFQPNGTASVIFGLISPLALYLIAIFFYLVIDLWRAVLSLLKT
ncbi:MAG: hypothetical protein WCA81_03865 [Rhizomicrobium sp.]